MPSLFDHITARLAALHARRVYGRFSRALGRVRKEQQWAMQRALALVADGGFGRRHGLSCVRALDDLRSALPLQSYDDLHPWLDRVWAGDTGALFSPRQPILMFASSSGTTARPKRIPVTPEFVKDYRRGWNTFGLKMLSDHPRAILRPILQGSGRYDESHSPAGVPCGAITGLLARTQKRIVRRYYVGRPELANLREPRSRYYTLMRLGIVRDVAFAITANPATLIQMAKTAAEEADTLIRDVHDGTLSRELVPEPGLRAALATGLRPAPTRAAELERLRKAQGLLRPRDFWDLVFLACWTGGSMGHYLPRLREWYGPLPVRDVGLLASEGRVSIPLADNGAASVLDVQAALFEFIPAEQALDPAPDTLWAWELEPGHDYAVVLTNTSGLVRYRLGDVVRMHGWQQQAPVIEFLHRAGRVSSVAGEKITEHQVVEAVRQACDKLGVQGLDFLIAPRWADPPFYLLSVEGAAAHDLAQEVDIALCAQNEEYASRRKSLRLGMLQARSLRVGAIAAMDRELIAARRSTSEQYKRPCLFTQPGEDDQALPDTAL